MSCHVEAFALWQSSHRREKPANTWLGDRALVKDCTWQEPQSLGVVAYWLGDWPRWQLSQSSLAWIERRGKRLLECFWYISLVFVHERGL